MTLVKFRPMRSALATPARLDRLVDSFFNDNLLGFGQDFGGWAPQVDVEETKDAIVFHADLPGLSKKDITITTEKGTLTICGERKNEVDDPKSQFHCVERSYGSFRRSFTLPNNVKVDSVEATYRDGVLEVSVPKADEVKPKSIEIKG